MLFQIDEMLFKKKERRDHLLLKEAKIHQNHSSKLVEQKASVIS